MALSDLGFSVDEERIYRLLLAGPFQDLQTLGRDAGLDDAALRIALDGLSGRGVIDLSPDGVKIPDPRVAIGDLVERAEDDLMARYRRVSGTRSDVSDLSAAYAGSSTRRWTDGDVERLEGLEAVRDRIAELSFFARTSVYAIHPGGPQSPESLEASRPLDRRAVRRRMNVRVIHSRTVLDDELNRAYLNEMVTFGVQARVCDDLGQRLIVLDEQVAITAIDPQNSRRGALVVRHPGLVAGFVGLFQRTWDGAEELPWATDSAQSGPEVAEEDRQLLLMLASGCTDETIAREIGISVRHLRRRIARLMAELGAHSRFEAGVEAARRGWL